MVVNQHETQLVSCISLILGGNFTSTISTPTKKADINPQTANVVKQSNRGLFYFAENQDPYGMIRTTRSFSSQNNENLDDLLSKLVGDHKLNLNDDEDELDAMMRELETFQ